MNTTTIHIKTDISTRDAAKKVAEDFGFSLTALVNALLKQIARTKRLSLDIEISKNYYLPSAPNARGIILIVKILYRLIFYPINLELICVREKFE